MTSHFLVPFNTWFLTGPTSRQCALYLGNKDPIREGREVRAGLDLRVQISHQAGTDHQIGLFFWGGLFLTDCWSHSHDSVFLRGSGRGFRASLWTLTESGEGCRFTVLESRIFDVHLMSLLLRKMQLVSFIIIGAYIFSIPLGYLGENGIFNMITPDCLWCLPALFHPLGFQVCRKSLTLVLKAHRTEDQNQVS